MVIRQGDVFWAQLRRPAGSEPGFRRPVIVIQNDVFNRSRLETVVVCAVTTNVRLSASPGNVALGKGEANLPRRSVANITQVATLDKADLVRKIGTLSPRRLGEVLAGVEWLLRPAEA